MSGTADLVSLANSSERRYSPAVLTNWLRLDRLSVLRAGLGKIVFHISERVLVIVSPRGGLEKLSGEQAGIAKAEVEPFIDRKSTRLNSSHQIISYAVFCLKKKKTRQQYTRDETPESALCLKQSESVYH